MQMLPHRRVCGVTLLCVQWPLARLVLRGWHVTTSSGHLAVLLDGWLCCTCLQNQNPFVSFRDVWQSLPRCARVLLVWVLLEAVFIVIYATTVLITGTQQQFIFPLLVGAPLHCGLWLQ